MEKSTEKAKEDRWTVHKSNGCCLTHPNDKTLRTLHLHTFDQLPRAHVPGLRDRPKKPRTTSEAASHHRVVVAIFPIQPQLSGGVEVQQADEE